MIQYTTPTITIRVRGADITACDVTVSLRQTIRKYESHHVVDIDADDLTLTLDGDDTLVTFQLTQAQTGGFVPGEVEAQVNYGSTTTRMATTVVTLKATKNLLSGQVTFDTATAPDTASAEVDATTSVPPGSVGSTSIADGAVTTAKLADGAVTAAKLGVTVGYAISDGDLTITLT